MSVIAVVDYGMGNLRSVDKALEHVAQPGQQVRVTSSADEIASADRIVFPGRIDDDESIGCFVHGADSAEAKLQLVLLTIQGSEFLFTHLLELG